MIWWSIHSHLSTYKDLYGIHIIVWNIYPYSRQINDLLSTKWRSVNLMSMWIDCCMFRFCIKYGWLYRVIIMKFTCQHVPYMVLSLFPGTDTVFNCIPWGWSWHEPDMYKIMKRKLQNWKDFKISLFIHSTIKFLSWFQSNINTVQITLNFGAGHTFMWKYNNLQNRRWVLIWVLAMELVDDNIVDDQWQ